MELQTIIFIGRSGCGKGTQAEKLIQYLKNKDSREIFHLEAGARFRQFIKSPGYASQLAKGITEAGALQPEFLSVWAWASEFAENLKENEHLIIDGTPRRLREAYVLETSFSFFQRPKIDIVYINVSEDWAKEKMLARGRSDDKELSDVMRRLEWFNTDVLPVVDYYRNNGLYRVHEINGEPDIENVHADIIKSLGI